MAFSFNQLLTNPILNPAGALINYVKNGSSSGGSSSSGGTLANNLSPNPVDVGNKNYDEGLESKPIPTIYYIIGGVLILATIGLIIYKKKKNK